MITKNISQKPESTAGNGHTPQIAPLPTDPTENALPPLGEKIFLDRYALKDMRKTTLKEGDIVIVCTNLETGQREIGTATRIAEGQVTVELRDGAVIERSLEQVDKPLETHPSQMIDRVARALAEIETPEKQAEWAENFRWLLNDWKFVPGGRILTGAGTDQNLTYYNCYVIPSPHDSRGGIMETLTQMTEIMSRGGGVGINISSLRPHHAYVKGVNGRSSGSVSWGALYSFVTGLIEQGGSRRGALMLILNVWHPDILEFVNSKRKMGQITNANISVGITDDFMAAVKADGDWDLVFPDTGDPDYDRLWDGNLAAWQAAGKPIVQYKTVKAREIWQNIIESAWASAEPGLWFMDHANKMSNSWYFNPLISTNPCGEQPLPAWSVCNLGALNLARFVKDGDVDWATLKRAVRTAVRFLDNVIDDTPYFFEENAAQQLAERRVGLGTMGLAEMLIRLKIRYGSPESEEFLDRLYRFIAGEAYLASADYAAEKGSFEKFEAEKFLQSGFMQGMPEEVRAAVREKGIRNVTLLTQAPTGTTGTMIGTSTGIEPYYFWSYYRKSRLGRHEEKVDVVAEWQAANPGQPLPDYFVTAMDLKPEDHVRVQAAIQRWVDSSISKCVIGSTLILTENGLIPISELSGLRKPDQFEPMEINIITPIGTEKTDMFYCGGLRETYRVSLALGFEIEGTPNHQIHILDEQGRIRFARLDNIDIGDTVVLYKGQQVYGSANQPLSAYSGGTANNHKPISFPGNMSTDLAYLLGCITSEGCISRNGVSISNSDKKLLEELATLFQKLFGLNSNIYRDKRRDNLFSLQVNSRPLRNWLLNDLRMKAGVENKTIPLCILRASFLEIKAFLRGLMLDAYVTLDGKMFGIGLASEVLVRQLQTLFLNFGVIARIHQASKNAWAVTVAGKALDLLADIIEFDDAWKSERMASRHEERQKSPFNLATLMPQPLTMALREMQKNSGKSLRSLYGGQTRDYQRTRVGLMRGRRLRREDSIAVYNHYLDNANEYTHNFFNYDREDYLYVEVRTIEQGFAEVFDLSVPNSHTFIANGIGNHNTCNVPNEYTVDQVRELYELMYELGCKGGTIYRDGSRDEQVLHRAGKEDESRKEKPAEGSKPAPLPDIKARVRPTVLHGITYRKHTPVGTAYITINSNGSGDQQPFEIFINVSKVGSDVAADAEGLGRLISLLLRMPSPLSPYARAQDVIGQLRGIGSGQQRGFGKQRVMSLADAVAQALAEHIGFHPDADLPGLPDEEDEHNPYQLMFDFPKGDICPSCGNAALLMIEGCKKCYSCGYSQC